MVWCRHCEGEVLAACETAMQTMKCGVPLLPLEIPEQPNPPPRPGRLDPSTLREAATDALTRVENWSNYEPGDDDLTDLMEAIKRHDADGYRMAKLLEGKFGWDPDGELVEILDRSFAYEPHVGAVKNWVHVNTIKPKLKIGDTVSYRGDAYTIIHILHETAEYEIKKDKHRYIVGFEEACQTNSSP
jgi:hypothetical protein